MKIDKLEDWIETLEGAKLPPAVQQLADDTGTNLYPQTDQLYADALNDAWVRIDYGKLSDGTVGWYAKAERRSEAGLRSLETFARLNMKLRFGVNSTPPMAKYS
jgi:hypothetical protein